ncbi:FtsX-like permease family protein [Gammaproteobacteria bacterium]|nr:FtsX-like permease family protein [Gammaproteobacteria bacterium]
MTYALEILDLKKTYPGGTEALKGISLTVKEGDFYALLGPNGAGKSSTIGIIGSLVTKTSGMVKIFGIDADKDIAEAKTMLGVVLGSDVPKELKTTATKILNKEVLIAGNSYKVIGVLTEEGSTGWQNPDDELYVPLLTGSQRLFGTKNLDSLNIAIEKDANVDEVMMTIERILRSQHDIGPGEDNDFRINDYSQYSDLRKQATGIFTALIAGIAGISLVVGGIGVMNIMLVSVTERTREIGLRKALGATYKAIMLQFIIEAVLLCVIGGTVGVILGTSILYLFASFNEWPFAMPISAIVGSITFSAMVGLFFGIWPARKAANLDPATSLRYE